MNFATRWRKSILRFSICSIIGLTVFVATVHQPVSAQSDLTLKSDIVSLKARINRLEQEVNNLRSSNTNLRSSTRIPTAPQAPKNSPPTTIEGQAIGSSDPMFKRLATLLIELKEDVRNLDRRLSKIEQRN